MIMSPQGAVGSPQRAPKKRLESENEGQSSPEELESSENDLKTKHVNVHKTNEKQMKLIAF